MTLFWAFGINSPNAYENVDHKKDYNGDGQITLMDIVYVLQSLSGLNNDQNIRIMDAVYLMQVLGNTGVN